MQRVCVTRSFIFGSQSNNLHLFSTSTLTSSDSFANYLVNSLGYSHYQALCISNKLSHYNKKVNDFRFRANATFVVAFFKQHGFDDTLLRNIVSCDPRLLSSNVDKTLMPKVQFLQGLGFSGPDIVRIIYVNPTLLFRGAESSILPAVQVLRQVLVCDTHVVTVLKRVQCKTFTHIVKFLLPNVALLMSYGIPIESIRKHLVRQPWTFLQNPEVFKDKVIRVEKKLGITPDTPMFLYGVHLVCGFSEETIQSKCRMFKSFGWTQSEVEIFIMKNACCFTFSKANIKKKLDFLMNELQFKPRYLTSKVIFLTCSLEKRMMPRHKVTLLLKEKCLMLQQPSLFTIVKMSEPCFLKRFVLPFKEVHDVYARLTSCDINILVQRM